MNSFKRSYWDYSEQEILFNPFSTNVPLLYPLKTSENLRFSDVFRGYRSGTLVENELKCFCKRILLHTCKINHRQSVWFGMDKSVHTCNLRRDRKSDGRARCGFTIGARWSSSLNMYPYSGGSLDVFFKRSIKPKMTL